jgi:hypothetical protein
MKKGLDMGGRRKIAARVLTQCQEQAKDGQNKSLVIASKSSDRQQINHAGRLESPLNSTLTSTPQSRFPVQ